MAEAEFAAVCEKDPTAAVAWYGAALLAAQRDDYGLARRRAEKLVEVDPLAHDAVGLLGRICSAQGEFEFGEKYLDAAIYMDPESVENIVAMGVMLDSRARWLVQMGENGAADYWSRAETLFRRALLLSPYDAEIHFNLAVVLGQQGEDREQEEELEEVLKHQHNSPIARELLEWIRSGKPTYMPICNSTAEEPIP